MSRTELYLLGAFGLLVVVLSGLAVFGVRPWVDFHGFRC